MKGFPARMLNDAYRKGQEKDQVKDDLETGKERGQEQAERGKHEHSERSVRVAAGRQKGAVGAPPANTPRCARNTPTRMPTTTGRARYLGAVTRR